MTIKCVYHELFHREKCAELDPRCPACRLVIQADELKAVGYEVIGYNGGKFIVKREGIASNVYAS